MLKFILDVGVGNKVFDFLSEQGYDTLSVSTLDHSMSDVDILSIAEQDERMVITMDKDFGELVYRSGKNHRGVLLLRLEGATGQEKVVIVRQILESFADQIEDSFCVFQNGQLRIRR